MGAKITIDSATLVNKGLEVIEAHWLYDVAVRRDRRRRSTRRASSTPPSSSSTAPSRLSLAPPTCDIPIQYALTYPDRLPSPRRPSTCIAAGRLDFRAPDETRFPALRIAREAGRQGSRATAALIAADEVAVARFLDGTLDFPGIPRLLEAAVERFGDGATRRPTSTSWSALDAEVRAAFATGPVVERSRDGARPGGIDHDRPASCVILGGLVLIHELGHFVDGAPGAACASTSSASASRRARRSSRTAARRSTPSTGCPSAASSSSRARTATTRTTRARSSGRRWHEAHHPARRRADEPLRRVLHLLPHRLAARRPTWVSGSARSRRSRRPRRPGSRRATSILSVDGRQFDVLRDVDPGGRIRSSAGTTVTLEVRRDGHDRARSTVTLRRPAQVDTTHGTPRHPWQRGRPRPARTSPGGRSLPLRRSACDQTQRALDLILRRPRRALARTSSTNPTTPPSAAGPIGIGVQIGNILWAPGPVFTLYFAGLLSANLALVNILPFPPLDGGRMLVIVLKSLVGNRLSAPGGAADLPRRVRVPVRVPHLDHRVRHRPARRRRRVTTHGQPRQPAGRYDVRRSPWTSAACSSARHIRSSSSR